MIIGIDGNEANQKVRAGSNVYAFELLRQFKKYKVSGIKYQVYLKNDPIEGLPKKSGDWQYKIVGPKTLWTQIGLPIRLLWEKLKGEAPDIFFTPSHYAPRFSPIPTVITIFDLSFIKFPEMFNKKDLYQLKSWTEYSVKRAKKIITISEFSKREIVDYYKIPENKVVVAYPGYDKEKFKVQSSKFKVNEVIKKYNINSQYLLFVGTIQPRKNLVRLIEAFEKLKTSAFIKTSADRQNLKLVICGMIKEGRGGWMQEEVFQKIQNPKSKIQRDIILTGYVGEDQLPYLMVGAKALVLPSLYEGFGIPALEAMACGTLVVVSRTSSLPEVCGKAAIYIENPYSVDSIVSALTKAINLDGKEREEMIKLGLRQTDKFSWEKTANIILKNLNDGR